MKRKAKLGVCCVGVACCILGTVFMKLSPSSDTEMSTDQHIGRNIKGMDPSMVQYYQWKARRNQHKARVVTHDKLLRRSQVPDTLYRPDHGSAEYIASFSEEVDDIGQLTQRYSPADPDSDPDSDPDVPESVISLSHDLHDSSLTPSQQYNITLWSEDFDIAYVSDIKHSLQPLGVRFLEQSRSPQCGLANTCPKKGKPLRAFYNVDLSDEDYANYYKENPEASTADAYLCVQPPAMCQTYLRSGRPVVIVVTDRYEEGRQSAARWRLWNSDVEKMASMTSKHTLIATNMYDLEYIRYFTAKEVLNLPPLCQYITATYSPRKRDYLLYPIGTKNFQSLFWQKYNDAINQTKSGAVLSDMGMKYPGHVTPSQLVQHPGIVVIPHQVSFLRFIEFYRMNIPLFVPSLQLLTTWHMKHNIIYKRTMYKKKHGKSKKSVIAGKDSLPDPNDEADERAVGFWLNFADFYVYPGIVYFTSIAHLVKLMEDSIHDGTLTTKHSFIMRKFNVQSKTYIQEKWRKILTKIENHKEGKKSK